MVGLMPPMDTKNIYHRPVIPLLLSFAAGIAFGYEVFGYKALALAIVLLSAGFVMRRAVCGRPSAVAPLIFFASMGWLYIQFWTSPVFGPQHVAVFANSHAWRVSGTVAEEPLIQGRRTLLYLDVNQLSQGKRSFPVSGKIRVAVTGDAPVLKKNDLLSFTGKIRSFHNFSNPGGFDYERFMAFKGVWGSAYVQADRLTVNKPGSPETSLNFLDGERRRISGLIENAAGQDSREILKALIIGDQTGISAKQREVFNRTGTGHLLAISGLHVGIVATFCFFIFQRLLSRSLYLLQKAWVKKIAAVLSLVPIAVYGLISGMSASTQRAVIMIFVFLMTFWVRREQDPANTLAAAALVILMVFPPALFSISFQLSFSAVAGILFGMSRFYMKQDSQDGLARKSAKQFLGFLSISLFAFLGTLPLCMVYFNQMSLIAVLANCIGVPIVGFLVVPLGLASAFASIFSDFIPHIGFGLCIRILDITIAVLAWIASFPFAAVKTVTPNSLEILCYYLFMWGVCDFRNSRRMRFMAAVIALVLAIDIGYWAHRRFFDDALRITAMDVGQGTATVLEFPGGFTMMIDGGGFADNALFDVGERIIAPYLLQNKIRTVDVLVLSHADSDHLNGLIYIADHFNVKSVWTNGQKAQTLGYKKLMAVISEKKIDLPRFLTIARSRMICGVRVEVLYPPKNFDADDILYNMKDPNDNCIVVRASYGLNAFLFPGDITESAESELISTHKELSATVLFSSHHGSDTSSSESFLKAVNPGYMIISAGWRNRFHFPHASVLHRCQKRGIKIYRTDLNGAIRIETDGKTLRLFPTIVPEDEAVGQ
jgi:competence protein ComEC